MNRAPEIVQLSGVKIPIDRRVMSDAVILPGLNRRTDTNKSQLLNWRERVIGEHPIPFSQRQPRSAAVMLAAAKAEA